MGTTEGTHPACELHIDNHGRRKQGHFRCIVSMHIIWSGTLLPLFLLVHLEILGIPELRRTDGTGLCGLKAKKSQVLTCKDLCPV